MSASPLPLAANGAAAPVEEKKAEENENPAEAAEQKKAEVCGCCGKAKEGSGAPDGETSKDDKDKKGSGEGGNGFTPEQDEKLKTLKGQNKTWKEVAAALGIDPKDINRLKMRWKEIVSGAASGVADAAGAGVGGSEKKKKGGGGKQVKFKKRVEGDKPYEADDDGGVKVTVEEVGVDEWFSAVDVSFTLFLSFFCSRGCRC